MRILRKTLCSIGLVILFGGMFACKVSEDAAAAAQQMTTTAADLTAYYNSLAEAASDSIALNELDAAFSKVPFDANSKRILQDTVSEIGKRKQAAQALAQLASSMSALAGSKASSDTATAATALGNELVQVKALPGGSPIPDALGKAGSLLLQIAQQHKEKEAARAMDHTLAALVSLFEKEKPTYDTIYRNRIFLAAQVSKDLIGRGAVDSSPLLAHALKPFSLAALPVDAPTKDTLRKLAISRLETTATDAQQAEMNASAAMLAAMQEMSSRVHLLAEEKPMPVRGNPFSLKVVESWVAAAI